MKQAPESKKQVQPNAHQRQQQVKHLARRGRLQHPVFRDSGHVCRRIEHEIEVRIKSVVKNDFQLLVLHHPTLVRLAVGDVGFAPGVEPEAVPENRVAPVVDLYFAAGGFFRNHFTPGEFADFKQFYRFQVVPHGMNDESKPDERKNQHKQNKCGKNRPLRPRHMRIVGVVEIVEDGDLLALLELLSCRITFTREALAVQFESMQVAVNCYFIYLGIGWFGCYDFAWCFLPFFPEFKPEPHRGGGDEKPREQAAHDEKYPPELLHESTKQDSGFGEKTDVAGRQIPELP